MNKIIYKLDSGQILANPSDKQDIERVMLNYDNAGWVETELTVAPLWDYSVNLETLEVEKN